jgi:dihydroorotate dehydrogenase (fumarate)
MGLELAHPLVPSASPLSETLDGIRRLEDAGASAVVMYSLFEKQIVLESLQLDHYLRYGEDSFSEALSYFPDLKHYHVGPEQYLNLIRRATAAVEIPIIGSLNGAWTSGNWTRFAREIEAAGAAALELNIYFLATDPFMTGSEVEEMYLQVLREVRRTVTIPIAIKLSPYFSAMGNMARRLAGAGADALVLFNRFYQPDFDLEQLEVVPHLVLSRSDELRLPLRWVALLHGRIPVDFAITTGVHTHIDVLKGLMAGAKVTMMASELLQRGTHRLGEIRRDLVRWMEEHEYEAVEQLQGSMSQLNVAEPAAFERANYMKVLGSWRPDPTGTDPQAGQRPGFGPVRA